jgi:cyclohexyl-isocyanide hydratase
MRWLFHACPAADEAFSRTYAPPSLAREGFIHASYKDLLEESVRLYLKGVDVRVLAIDPRRLDVPVDVADTPRGPMPHVHGPIPADAVRVIELADVAKHDDEVRGTRIAFLAFHGMTLLDLVGPLDALSRIATMGFDPSSACEVVALAEGPVWSACGMEVRTSRVRAPLADFDVLLIPGGLGTRALVEDASVLEYVRSFPANRLTASVCTGSLVLGAAGRLRGKRATTHHLSYDLLATYGATLVKERVVDEGQLVTAGGVTSGLDLGVHLVRRIYGSTVASAIASQMEMPNQG